MKVIISEKKTKFNHFKFDCMFILVNVIVLTIRPCYWMRNTKLEC